MTLLPINGIIIAAVFVAALAVIIYWHRVTRGSWKDWPAGRSLMGLLTVIVLISGMAATNVLFLPPAWPGKVVVYLALYSLVFVALIYIGGTIHHEMKRGKARLQQKKPHDPTGPVTVTVATKNEEEAP